MTSPLRLCMAPTPDDDAKSVGDVVAEFQRVLREGARPRVGKLAELLVELHATNLSQWGFEDRVRVPGVDIATIAHAKHAIDRLNAKRHQLVEGIDLAIDGTMVQVPSAMPATESPAMVFDRLSVLVDSNPSYGTRGRLRRFESCELCRTPPGPLRPAGGTHRSPRCAARRRAGGQEAVRPISELETLR